MTNQDRLTFCEGHYNSYFKAPIYCILWVYVYVVVLLYSVQLLISFHTINCNKSITITFLLFLRNLDLCNFISTPTWHLSVQPLLKVWSLRITHTTLSTRTVTFFPFHCYYYYSRQWFISQWRRISVRNVSRNQGTIARSAFVLRALTELSFEPPCVAHHSDMPVYVVIFRIVCFTCVAFLPLFGIVPIPTLYCYLS